MMTTKSNRSLIGRSSIDRSRALLLAILLLLLAASSVPQELPSPIADARFQDVTEDWTTPALGTSHLIPVRPLVMPDKSHTGYTLDLLQVQWRSGDPLDLYVLKPKDVKNPPVILYLFGYPTDTDIFKNDVFQEAVTKDGFAAVGFVSALTGSRYHDRPLKQWFLSELQESLGESAHDVQMVLNYLDTRGDLDMSRVGMFGQGSGGSIAILASAVDQRIKVLDVLDPWGDWPIWMAESPFVPENERPDYVKADFLKNAAKLEPVDWLAKLQAKKFRFQDAVTDAKTPKEAKEKLRAAAPQGTTFVFYKTADEFAAAYPPSSMNLEWMQHELRSLPETAESSARPPFGSGHPSKK
ncbi:MAG TPA: hypothetical protein VKR59_12665 [Terriglobales bacterium]|nr:hypothetical protein [Terriglobales bacterium]